MIDKEIAQSHEDTMMLHFTRGNSLMGDMYVLHRFAENRKVKVELGTAYGFASIMLSLHSGTVYTVDNHTFYTQQDKYTPEKKYRIIKDYMELYDGEHIKVIKNDTVKEAENWNDDSIDLLFIDAGHEYNEVRADYNAWYPKVKKDSVIIFHDVDPLTEGVWKFWTNDMMKEIKMKRVRELVQSPKHKTVCKVVVKL